MKKYLILTLIALSCFGATNSPANESDVQEVRRLYAGINESIKKDKAQRVLLYVDSDGYAVKKWNKLAGSNEKDLVKMESTYKAWVYISDGQIIKAIIYIDSLSGDWEHTTEYYFYSNGKAAFIFDKHFTFLANLTDEKGEDVKGPFIVERRFYFSLVGKKIKMLEKAFIRDNKKEVPVDDVQQIKPDFYYDVKSLPFINLISSTK